MLPLLMFSCVDTLLNFDTVSCYAWVKRMCHLVLLNLWAKHGSEVSDELDSLVDSAIFVYIYIYIYIYIYVCLQVHCTRPCTPYASPITSAIVHLERRLLFGAALWGVALSLGMADGASSAADSPDHDSDYSRTSTTTEHTKRLDDDSDLGRTHTATGQKKRSLIS